jgi:hypothetical protein
MNKKKNKPDIIKVSASPVSQELVVSPIIQEILQEATYEPVQLKLTREEVLELAFLEQQYRHGTVLSELESMKRDALLLQIDPQNKIKLLDTKIRAATIMHTNAKAQWLEVRAAISKRLGGIDLDQYAYDDKTGTLQKPDQ